MVEYKPEMQNNQPEVMDGELTVGRTEVNFESEQTVTDLVMVEEFKNGNIFGKIVPF